MEGGRRGATHDASCHWQVSFSSCQAWLRMAPWEVEGGEKRLLLARLKLGGGNGAHGEGTGKGNEKEGAMATRDNPQVWGMQSMCFESTPKGANTVTVEVQAGATA